MSFELFVLVSFFLNNLIGFFILYPCHNSLFLVHFMYRLVLGIENNVNYNKIVLLIAFGVCVCLLEQAKKQAYYLLKKKHGHEA